MSAMPKTDVGHDEHQQQHNPAINRIPRARPDELQGLLADPDTDTEAERMSLHSNPGRSRNKKKRRTKKTSNNPRRISLFGRQRRRFVFAKDERGADTDDDRDEPFDSVDLRF
ncbi:hypothetical protein NLJ89_g9253 [Agrocybe chaxingu]|uniref:Uncharacterized protein n=1 Tax=Agrocybe chaxingu TaxID=84603 RepID=A0A9W8JST5_9AGAR|nr:hypothetical protein NLJ89_g9253 [Agrocybe chaxingu]